MLVIDGPVRIELEPATREETEAALTRLRALVGMYLTTLDKKQAPEPALTRFPEFSRMEYQYR